MLGERIQSSEVGFAELTAAVRVGDDLSGEGGWFACLISGVYVLK